MRIILIIIVFAMTAFSSKAQQQGQQNAQLRIQQLQNLLGVNEQSASSIFNALMYKQMEISAIKKNLSYGAQQKEQLLSPLLAARQTRIDSVMTPAQQQLLAQKQKQLKEAAAETLKTRAASTRQQLQHPVSGGTF